MLGIRHFKGTAIDIFQGDITEFVCDAMVNAANSELKGGGGVDGAIHRIGGPEIMAELAKMDGCPTGQAVVTTAGKLPARHVIHAVGPIWQNGSQGEAKLLASAYDSALHCAADLNARHVAFPSLSTGVYRFPLQAAAEIAMKTVRAFALRQPTNPKRITFVLFDRDHYGAFQDQLFKIFPEEDQT